MQERHSSNRLYFFDLIHHDFVAGEEKVFPSAVTRDIAIKQFSYLMLVIALPMIIFITLMISLAGYDYELLIIVEIVTAVFVCGYFVLRRYLKDRELRHHGQIIFGQVVRVDESGYTGIGSSNLVRVYYRFLNNENRRVIAYVDLNYVMHRLPDGRKYPSPGTPVAILYASEQNYKLL